MPCVASFIKFDLPLLPTQNESRGLQKLKHLKVKLDYCGCRTGSYFLHWLLEWNMSWTGCTHYSLLFYEWVIYYREERNIILLALVMSCLYLRRLSLSVGGAEQSLSQSGPIEAPVHQILDVPHTLLASGGQNSWTFIKNTAGISFWHIWVQSIYQMQKST